MQQLLCWKARLLPWKCFRNKFQEWVVLISLVIVPMLGLNGYLGGFSLLPDKTPPSQIYSTSPKYWSGGSRIQFHNTWFPDGNTLLKLMEVVVDLIIQEKYILTCLISNENTCHWIFSLLSSILPLSYIKGRCCLCFFIA